MSRKPPGKRNPDLHIPPDSDETFAYIAGYTSGGAPYGITWEEQEMIDQRATKAKAVTPPEQKRPVSLKDLAGEMQVLSDTISVYYRRSTGEFIPVTDEYVWVVDEGDPYDDRPEWEQEAIRQAAEVLEHEDDGDYVLLPSKFEIHEYAMMEEFCHKVKSPKIAKDLVGAIAGRGAFRRFKAAVQRHGVTQEWHQFRDESFLKLAAEWCKEHGITCCDR